MNNILYTGQKRQKCWHGVKTKSRVSQDQGLKPLQETQTEHVVCSRAHLTHEIQFVGRVWIIATVLSRATFCALTWSRWAPASHSSCKNTSTGIQQSHHVSWMCRSGFTPVRRGSQNACCRARIWHCASHERKGCFHTGIVRGTRVAWAGMARNVAPSFGLVSHCTLFELLQLFLQSEGLANEETALFQSWNKTSNIWYSLDPWLQNFQFLFCELTDSHIQLH